MQISGFSVILLVTSLLVFAQTPDPTPAKPYDRLIAATKQNALTDPDLKPWHLNLDVTVFDAKGKNPVSGTIETWHSGETAKTAYTFGSASRTVLRSNSAAYEAKSGPDVPVLADAILEAFIDPGPSVRDIEDAQLDLRKESFGKVALDCIMLTQPIKRVAYAPMGLFPTYCLDPQGTKLRATYNFGSQTVLRNNLGIFQGHEVSTHLSLDQDGINVADAKVTTLTTFTPAADFFQPDPAWTQLQEAAARIPGGVIAGAILTKVQPTYPESAKANHVGGAVVLRAIIGRDGHIYSLRPLSAPDPDLAISAIAAVRHWTYKPYLLNGFPCEVDTTITVNYNLN